MLRGHEQFFALVARGDHLANLIRLGRQRFFDETLQDIVDLAQTAQRGFDEQLREGAIRRAERVKMPVRDPGAIERLLLIERKDKRGQRTHAGAGAHQRRFIIRLSRSHSLLHFYCHSRIYIHDGA